MNHRALSILLIVALIISGGTTVFFAVRARQATQRAVAAEKKLHAQDFLKNYAATMQPGTFVRATKDSFTYTTPVQTTVKGETFIGKEEHTVAYDPSFTVFGGLFGDGPETVTQLQAGTSIRVQVRGTGAQARIEALYVSP